MESDKIKQVEKKVCSNALALAFIVFSCFYATGHIPLGKGFLLGTLFSIINFTIMGATIRNRIATCPKDGAFRALPSIAIRYLVMALPLFVAIKSDSFDLFATAAGLLSVQASIMMDVFKSFALKGAGLAIKTAKNSGKTLLMDKPQK